MKLNDDNHGVKQQFGHILVLLDLGLLIIFFQWIDGKMFPLLDLLLQGTSIGLVTHDDLFEFLPVKSVEHGLETIQFWLPEEVPLQKDHFYKDGDNND